MNKNLSILLMLVVVFLSTMPVQAQRRAKVTPRAKVVNKQHEKTAEHNELFTNMLSATAKVMFIDSVVVPKYSFLKFLKIGQGAGTISVKSDKFGEKLMPLTQFENELGDKRIFAEGDTAATSLCSQSLLGKGWSQPSELKEIDGETYRWQDFPFLMADGVTLLFSAKGPQSIGGRDIFMTRFDADKGTYLEPQNYGLPFNSTANDYLLAIDDIDTLGWLVSDRYQPRDSVCIYTFVPTYPRQDFQQDNLTTAQLDNYARLRSIRSTWRFGNRWGAIQRRDNLIARSKAKQKMAVEPLPINDKLLAYNTEDLHQKEAKSLFEQLKELNTMKRQTLEQLDKLRQQYIASRTDALAQRIKKAELELQQQMSDVKMLAKKIRILENK